MDHKHNQQHMGRLRQPERQHQRFSWQLPLSTPPEEQAAAVYINPQQPQQRSEQQHLRGLSYVQTPVEHRGQQYTQQFEQPPLPEPSPPTPIDERPQSFYHPHNPITSQPQSQPQYAIRSYNHTPLSPVSPGLPAPPSYTHHPAIQSPVSPVHEPERTLPHVRQRSNLAPINTNVATYSAPTVPQSQIGLTQRSPASPLPDKPPRTPGTANLQPTPDPSKYPLPMSPNFESHAMEPYSPHGFGQQTPGQHAIFSPDAATGPNGLDFSLHRPGQIAHPNMDFSAKGTEHEWKHSLCECSGDVGTCMTGIFCPCVLYGRTAYRLTQKSEKKDPTDMLAYRSANGHCGLMGAACGLWCLFPLVQRTRLRHLYKLSGSLFGDIGKACCCCCCMTIQNEREVRDREESSRRWAGPASTEVYRTPMQMAYTPQR
ncbi:PLAC8-domain-containing protein [Delitschia confertaspora ATCC 74209]|uniref:PLAC8-domain-containing protein n=1 Tax=Delitschia confertaspora ATCC 74209 TaxID=1513339 RepID=A0A9P4JEB2_9PLEO|nr:PLAC8-domain-containing protein [Delitschia confertaspora ATCC 74209]